MKGREGKLKERIKLNDNFAFNTVEDMKHSAKNISASGLETTVECNG